MLYAGIVFGLPVEGPFDYSVDSQIAGKIKTGSRVWVNFCGRKKMGYVAGIKTRSDIKNIKPVLQLIDDTPVIERNIFSLAGRLSVYYGCSLGEALETALPEALRKGRNIAGTGQGASSARASSSGGSTVLIHDLSSSRWETYLKKIRENLENNRSVIMLLPGAKSAEKAKQVLLENFKIEPLLLYRKQPRELEAWQEARVLLPAVVIGMRSAVFAPVKNLGLIIIDEEQDTAYKQDQVPHYHAREAAFMRQKIEHIDILLGSSAPSMEIYHLAKSGKIGYKLLPRIKAYPEIKIIDMRREGRVYKEKNIILSKYLQDCIAQTLEAKGKVLLFLNRKGFATFVSCPNCAEVLKCPRCSVNLVYHFKQNALSCHLCHYKAPAPKICPNCNASYIRYAGTGTEKIESELARVFPAARIKMLDKEYPPDAENADIIISASSITEKGGGGFDLVCALAIDNSLNRSDLRSSEKVFASLSGLLSLTGKKMVIQTRIPTHPILKAIERNDAGIFYDKELQERKQLGFPPYRHFCFLKLRGKREERVRKAAEAAFEKLRGYAEENRAVDIISLNPGQPAKQRGNFYWQILVKSASTRKITGFLKMHLKDLPRSGIIVTVDMDPL
ncbi:MAG: primosomal protein N' [Candidatus Omnitrophica bacterium]|nr:primosomal protein N' [Candidatus Omnitrophota bacterium]MDD5553385.1 primosomal protein N' [Candidatus Omnitrophota bacterium]